MRVVAGLLCIVLLSGAGGAAGSAAAQGVINEALREPGPTLDVTAIIETAVGKMAEAGDALSENVTWAASTTLDLIQNSTDMAIAQAAHVARDEGGFACRFAADRPVSRGLDVAAQQADAGLAAVDDTGESSVDSAFPGMLSHDPYAFIVGRFTHTGANLVASGQSFASATGGLEEVMVCRTALLPSELLDP